MTFSADVRWRQPELCASIFLLAGLVQEGVRCPEPAEPDGLRRSVGQPFGHRAAETADEAVFFDGGDNAEARESIGQQSPVERLDGVEARRPRAETPLPASVSAAAGPPPAASCPC